MHTPLRRSTRPGVRRRALPALLALTLPAACATPIAEQRWVRARTAHFEIVSGAAPELTHRIARELERFRALVGEILPVGERDLDTPALVYVFGDTRTFSAYRPRRSVQGYMIPGVDRSYLVVNGGKIDAAIPVCFHEFVHLVLHARPSARYPAWFDEGLAELLSTVTFKDGFVEIGRIPRDRVSWLRYGTSLGLRRIMTARNVMHWSERAAAMFYAESWALTHFLHAGHLVGAANHLGPMQDYLRLVRRDRPPEAAFEEAFGESLEDFERRFLAYVAEGRIPFIEMAAKDLPDAVDVRFEPLARGEQLVVMGDLAQVLGQKWSSRAEAHYRDAVAAGAGEIAASSLARSLARRGARGAEEAARALSLATATDPASLERAGDAWLALARRAEDSAEARRRLDRARSLYERSLERGPGRVATLVGLAATYGTSAEENAAAIALLEQAARRQPSSLVVSAELARRYLNEGNVSRARPIVSALAETPHALGSGAVDESVMGRLAKLSGLDDVPVSRRHLMPRLEVVSPPPDEVLRISTSFSEVSGRGGLSEALFHDVVIAIDESNSTLAPAGFDVDRDGEVGSRRRHWRHSSVPVSSDPGDSVLMAELAAARQLLEQLDPETTRVALVFFSGEARLRAPLGSPLDAIEALDHYRYELEFTGTSHGNALAAAAEELRDHRDVERRRQRLVILLSDGMPTAPSPVAARNRSRRAAEFLGRHGIPVHAYGLGREALEGIESYQQIARLSGGRFVPVRSPGDLEFELGKLQLTGLACVSIRNVDTGEPARAVSVLADGSFSGFVPLAPGENRIEIVAHLEEHEPLRATRRIFYERPLELTPAQVKEAEELLERIANRTVELELRARMKAAREARATRRDFTLERESETPPAVGAGAEGGPAPAPSGP